MHVDQGLGPYRETGVGIPQRQESAQERREGLTIACLRMEAAGHGLPLDCVEMFRNYICADRASSNDYNQPKDEIWRALLAVAAYLDVVYPEWIGEVEVGGDKF